MAGFRVLANAAAAQWPGLAVPVSGKTHGPTIKASPIIAWFNSSRTCKAGADAPAIAGQ